LRVLYSLSDREKERNGIWWLIRKESQRENERETRRGWQTEEREGNRRSEEGEQKGKESERVDTRDLQIKPIRKDRGSSSKGGGRKPPEVKEKERNNIRE